MLLFILFKLSFSESEFHNSFLLYLLLINTKSTRKHIARYTQQYKGTGQKQVAISLERHSASQEI